MRDGFGLEHLPFGSFRHPATGRPQLGVAFGDDVVDLGRLAERLPGIPSHVLEAPNLDALLATDRSVWSELRSRLQDLLADGAPGEALIPRSDTTPCLPFTVGAFVDFYSSLEHATNMGRIYRPGSEPLPEQWRHLPIGYHGRSNTVVVSGTPIRRPMGQLPDSEGPIFGPTRRLDYEVELGFVTGGPPNPPGTTIAIEEADERIFGIVLVNDWSARDIQAWEYRPLGPFLGKSFATSISPWVVPLAALEPYRVTGPTQDPEPLPHLRTDQPWNLDVGLEVSIAPSGGAPSLVASVSARGLYWSAAQQLAHVASNGSVVGPGDLYASGTISGPEPRTEGSLIERTWNGERPLSLGGERRTFLEDGDVVTISGRASRDGAPTINFGVVSGQVLAAGTAAAARRRAGPPLA